MPKRVENRTTPTNHVLNGIKGTDNWLNGRAFQFYRTHLVLIWFPIKSVEFGVLDSLSNIQTKDGFFAGSGLKGITNFHYPEYYMDNKMGKPTFFSVVGERDSKIYFSNNDMNHDGILWGKDLRVGLINLTSKTVILPAFSKIGVFDQVSGPAYAELSTMVKASNGLTDQLKTTKGYINEQGEWVILQ